MASYRTETASSCISPAKPKAWPPRWERRHLKLINFAQRVMDCGDGGHILLSKHVSEDLEHYGHWQPHLHHLGECEVKHGVRLSIVNLYTEDLGNPAVPEK